MAPLWAVCHWDVVYPQFTFWYSVTEDCFKYCWLCNLDSHSYSRLLWLLSQLRSYWPFLEMLTRWTLPTIDEFNISMRYVSYRARIYFSSSLILCPHPSDGTKWASLPSQTFVSILALMYFYYSLLYCQISIRESREFGWDTKNTSKDANWNGRKKFSNKFYNNIYKRSRRKKNCRKRRKEELMNLFTRWLLIGKLLNLIRRKKLHPKSVSI